MVEFHTVYKGDEDDYQDVLALCSKFELPLPDYYEHFAKEVDAVCERTIVISNEF